MGQSSFTGPLKVGPLGEGGGVLLAKMVTLTANGTNTVNATVTVPFGASLLDTYFDVTTAWDSAVSATGTIGTASGGTQYAGGVNLKTATRGTPTYTTAQLAAMADVGGNTSVVFTATPSGATTAGVARGVIRYLQN
jgi:hypothetical protein